MNSTIPNRGPIAEPNFHITPAMINTDDHFWDAFGHDVTEVSANYIVRLMQIKGAWTPFSMKEIAMLYHRNERADTFSFNRLVEPGTAFYIERGNVQEGGGWIVVGEDGLYHITKEFIERCARSSPRKTA